MKKSAVVVAFTAAFCASAFAVTCETGAVLTHRWSFNGNLEDSVGGATAQKVGERAFNLGRGLVKGGDALTFEVWATPQVKPKDNWPRIFDWCSDKTHSLAACWANNSGNAEARVQITQDRILFSDDRSLTPTVPGKPCHFAITVQSAKDGSSRVKWSRRDVVTGVVEKAGAIDISDWSLASFIASMAGKDDFFLGHSRWSADTDAVVTYDEVRLWNTALSDEQLTANVKAGPDRLPATVEQAAAFAGAAKPIPAFLFGQNLEHTRAAIQGGLSAQLVRNRKFAGKPDRKGVAMLWEAYGSKAFYSQTQNLSFTRHAARSGMWRINECAAQMIVGLDEAGEAGVCQQKIGLRGGIGHTFRVVASTMNDEDVTLVLRVTAEGKTIAEKAFPLRSKTKRDWKRLAFDFTPPTNTYGEISVGVKGRYAIAVGVVSLMPVDNFRGMRSDVIDNLRDIGASVIRWPGGNFSGEYRWRDGLIADRDERAPLQAYTEIEQQPYGLGYDMNDIAMDDVIALCKRIGAEPFFTINAAWERPSDSADWVKACKGRVKLWSLGNEMGYGHMEGPRGPAAYTAMVRPHAEAMKKVDPSIRLFASGTYPGNGREWIAKSALPLSLLAADISYHRYDIFNQTAYDYSSSASTDALFRQASNAVDAAFDCLQNFRAILPRQISISYDEWNLWYTWYREEAIVEGLYAAKFLNEMMRAWDRNGVGMVCYFQPVNEQAITVSPFESHLTSLGEAMRLMKGHVGGVPADLHQIPREAFVTDAPDGTRYLTAYNFSTKETKAFALPLGARRNLVASEFLVPNGLVSGCRYQRRPGDARIENGKLVFFLPPASQMSARVK